MMTSIFSASVDNEYENKIKNDPVFRIIICLFYLNTKLINQGNLSLTYYVYLRYRWERIA